mgnify:CR=1 FL=1
MEEIQDNICEECKNEEESVKNNLIISNEFSLIKECDFVFVTVGTPQRANGAIELSMIKNSATKIGKILQNTRKNPVILIKSTVIPGTMKNIILPILEKNSKKKAGKDFGLISNPEFLQETTSIKDTKFPHAIVLGGEDTKFMKRAERFFSKMFSGVYANRFQAVYIGEDPIQKYWTLRQKALIFDVPEKPVEISGKDAIPFLEKILTRKIIFIHFLANRQSLFTIIFSKENHFFIL